MENFIYIYYERRKRLRNIDLLEINKNYLMQLDDDEAETCRMKVKVIDKQLYNETLGITKITFQLIEKCHTCYNNFLGLQIIGQMEENDSYKFNLYDGAVRDGFMFNKNYKIYAMEASDIILDKLNLCPDTARYTKGFIEGGKNTKKRRRKIKNTKKRRRKIKNKK
jgi:hypothetical protein